MGGLFTAYPTALLGHHQYTPTGQTPGTPILNVGLLLMTTTLLRNAASALLLSQSPFIEIYLNLTSTATGESTPPVHHGLISCQSVLLYLLSTFEQ
jgi:hypothetical protein